MSVSNPNPTVIPGLRSPYDPTGSIVYFGRMLDKVRLHAQGLLPEEWAKALGFAYPTSFDARCCRFREWNPQPAPVWVTCVPSLRHPDLVLDFARRLAAALGLPFHEALRKTDGRPEQKTMANSNQQARNIDGSLAAVEAAIHNGPVLLVDDMVDSGWTLTVAAYLLKTHGSGPVFPLALASTMHGE